ncbi:hypothetical protein ABI59_08620 [Acidobacteria bacterium Mor1]|nr:hypothetical protein ABI59_08620 [Acidobacteria bacterium Mor1]
MDIARWTRIQQIFDAARQRPLSERDAYVRTECAGDGELAREVLALLAEDEEQGSPLDGGPGAWAGDILDDRGVPATIGPYRIEKLLGEGGMGVVYLARRDDLDHLVAIKLLRDARLSKSRRDRFLREQRVLAGLTHPSICRLHDAGVLADGTPYFVMEYVDGLPLTEYCRRNRLGLERRLLLLRKIADAVRHAHRRALIHRDLKPSNVLVLRGPQDEEATVRLLDFGIAKQIETAAQAPTETAAGMMTPAYAAPEQLAMEPVGVYTDVYALGVLLYELLTGELPHDVAGLAPFAAAQTVLSQDPIRPSQRVRRAAEAPAFTADIGRLAWGDLDVLCLKAIQRDPERRYPTVDGLIRDLDHFLAGQPLEARPDNVGYRLRKFVTRNRTAVIAGTAVTVTAATLLTLNTVQLSRARDAAVEEASRTQRVQQFLIDLLQGGDEAAGPRDGLKVTTLLERGEREVGTLDGKPRIQAEVMHTLGGVYRTMGRLERSESLLRRALEQRRNELGATDPEVAETLAELGLALADRGELEAAEQHVREALGIVTGNLAPDHPRHAAVLQALASVLIDRGAYEPAIEQARKAAAIQERNGDIGGRLESLGYEANAHFYLGDYETSDSLNRELLAMTADHRGEEHPSYATCLINLAATRRWLGYLDEAEALYRQALRINEDFHGPDHIVAASNRTLLGAVLADQGRPEEARELLVEALAINEATYGTGGYEVALVLNKLALLDLNRGDLDAAEAGFRRELEIYRSVVGDTHASVATGWSNLATIAFRRGNPASAETLLRRSLGIYLEALGPAHIDVAFVKIKLGRLLVDAGRHAEAIPELVSGIEILEAQANPSLSWIEAGKAALQKARQENGEPVG